MSSTSHHDTLDIKPINMIDYTCKQSKHNHLPKVPLRVVILSPSGGGETVLLTNLILNQYRGCFDITYVFSPWIDLDNTWLPGKKYQEDVLHVSQDKNEKCYFDSYDPDDLENIISTQTQKKTKHLKQQGRNNYIQF